jgi:hypothetical protein
MTKRTALSITVLCLIMAVVVVFIQRAQPSKDSSEQQPIDIPHIHGLGYSSDGKQLIVPAHIGLLVYENAEWHQPDNPAHDYMGFSPTDKGFFSSGHPDLRTAYESLLGLIKSEDGGRTITTLAFEGESDFHLLAAGYRSHAVYVVNASPNSKIGEGLYFTLDEGQTWQRGDAQSLPSAPIQIAAHPEDSGTVAIATEHGLWLSTDYGNSFELVSLSEPVTAVTFDLKLDALYFGYQRLYRLDLATGEITTIPMPSLASDDSVSYITTNPLSSALAVTTRQRDVFLAPDGTVWTQIADNGSAASR